MININNWSYKSLSLFISKDRVLDIIFSNVKRNKNTELRTHQIQQKFQYKVVNSKITYTQTISDPACIYIFVHTPYI